MEKLFLLLETLETLNQIKINESLKLSKMNSQERIEYTKSQMREIEENHPTMVESISENQQESDYENDDFEPTKQ